MALEANAGETETRSAVGWIVCDRLAGDAGGKLRRLPEDRDRLALTSANQRLDRLAFGDELGHRAGGVGAEATFADVKQARKRCQQPFLGDFACPARERKRLLT